MSSNVNNYQFWRHDNKPIELWSNKVIDEKINYIHQNPVKEGYVFRAEDYMYSSAIDYTGEKGLLDGIIVVKQLQTTQKIRAATGAAHKPGNAPLRFAVGISVSWINSLVRESLYQQAAYFFVAYSANVRVAAKVVKLLNGRFLEPFSKSCLFFVIPVSNFLYISASACGSTLTLYIIRL
jgi:hypothetical protein